MSEYVQVLEDEEDGIGFAVGFFGVIAIVVPLDCSHLILFSEGFI